MTLEQFIQWAINTGQVGNPTADPNNQFIGECASLVQQYLNKVFGIAWLPRGNAKDWGNNPNVLYYFDRVKSPQAGDIGTSGAVPGNPYGHIWLYTSPNTILEQNGRVSRRVSTGNAYANPIAILRRKGTGEEEVKPSAQQVIDIFRKFLNSDPSQDQINHYVNHDLRVLETDVLNATVPTADEVVTAFKNQGLTATKLQIDHYTQRIATTMYRDLNAVAQTQGTVAEQKKQINELIAQAKNGGYTESDREIAKSTNSAVQWIKDKLEKIFK